MTAAELRTRVLKRAGEDPTAPQHYLGPMALAALNRSLRLFVLRSLCVERSDTFTLAAATAWYHVRDQLSDFLLPLRFEYGGAKVRPARLAELDALAATWQATAGAPERYAIAGQDLLAVYSQLAAGGSLTAVYAAAPARLVDDDDVPEIPTEYHDDLADAAVAFLRLAEGGQELEKSMPGLVRMIQGAGKLAGYVRQRSLDLRYDTIPAELDRYDASRLLAISKRRTSPWPMDSDTRPAVAQP